jgi:hypothetical protein
MPFVPNPRTLSRKFGEASSGFDVGVHRNG